MILNWNGQVGKVEAGLDLLGQSQCMRKLEKVHLNTLINRKTSEILMLLSKRYLPARSPHVEGLYCISYK